MEKIKIVFHGPAAEHNLTCWLCEKRPAVYHMNPTWVFGPCWDCEKKLGGTVRRVKNRFINWLLS